MACDSSLLFIQYTPPMMLFKGGRFKSPHLYPLKSGSIVK